MTLVNPPSAALPAARMLQVDTVTRFLATVLLTLLLVSVVAFPSIWPGRVAPLYLIIVVAGGLVALTSQTMLTALLGVVQRVGAPILLPWLVFVFVSAQLTAYHGTFAETVGSAVFLNIATLVLFVFSATLGVLVRPRTLVLILGVIALGEGLVALLQYLGFGWAWRLPVTMVGAFGGDPGDPYALAGVRSFEDVGRVRGTLLWVHKFNPMQGALAAILITVLLLGRARSAQAAAIVPRVTPFLIVAALAAVMGMVLAFSRSTIIGLALGVAFVLGREFRARTMLFALLGLVFAIVAGLILDLGEARQYGRLFNFAGSDLNNVVRYQQYAHALETFAASPLIGQSAQQQSADVIIFNLIHSVPLRILADFGLLGFVPYALVLFGIVRIFWAGAKVPEARGMALIGLAVFILLMVDSATHSSGFLKSDEVQSAIYGVLVGSVLAALPRHLRVRTIPHNPLSNFRFG